MKKANEPSKQELALAKQIADDNLRFEKASQAKKRVIIAEDVIKWLDAGKLQPTRGTYFRPVGSGVESDRAALGAVFACAVERAKAVKFSARFNGAREMRNQLAGHFELDQLMLIEAAFEGQSCFAYGVEGSTRAANFSRSSNPELRMRRIMENIIDNRGTFVP